MHRYEELEKIYYKRLYLKIFFYFFLVFIVIIGIIFFNSEKTHKNVVKQKEINNTKKLNQTNINLNKKESNETKKNIQDKSISRSTNKITKKDIATKDIQELKFILPNIDFIQEPKSSVKQTKKVSKVKKSNIKSDSKKEMKSLNVNNNISISETNADLKSLIREYQENKDYNLAITIAKIYFQKNNLKKAQIWALNANSLNPSKPDSWLLFADVLIKQHKIQKAVNLLKAYIDSYGNNDIIEEKLRSLNGK